MKNSTPKEVEPRQELRCLDCGKKLGEFLGIVKGTLWQKCPRCKEVKRWEFPINCK